MRLSHIWSWRGVCEAAGWVAAGRGFGGGRCLRGAVAWRVAGGVRPAVLPGQQDTLARRHHFLPTWLPDFAVYKVAVICRTDLARNVKARAGLLSWARSGVPGHS
jgi:hypothetical protein